MITHILIAVAALAVVIIIWAVCAWFIQREPAGKGQHAKRPDRLPARRWLLVQYRLRRQRAANFRTRVARGENPVTAWRCRYVPPMSSLIRLPENRLAHYLPGPAPSDGRIGLANRAGEPDPLGHLRAGQWADETGSFKALVEVK